MTNVDVSINNEFEQEVVDNGYKWFTDNWNHSIRGFQKRVSDDLGVKYFITGYHYNHAISFPDKVPYKDSYMFDVQFRINKEGKDQCIDVRFSAEFVLNKQEIVTTLNEVEEFYEKTWNDMKADYYELKN